MPSAQSHLVADRYRLVEPLGQGGMGRVWRARDEVLHRDVAIKELVPPPGLTAEERQEMRERSLREARAIARLNHINVVRVFDILRTDGEPWIVMEYVRSRSLQDVLASDGPVPQVRAAEIGLGVLEALRAAHRSGVMHRDVKPGNVLLGDDGRVVLTDFGLATVPGDPNVTRTGLVLGSPAYIAPERAKDGSAGPEGDLWSLGATLYAAVEGQSPYARPSAIETLTALATEPPPPPRRAGALKPVLNGLLRKDPLLRIKAEEAERLLRRAAGKRLRGGLSLLDGVRRPSPLGRREPRDKLVPGQPPPAKALAEPPAGPPAGPPAPPASTPPPAPPPARPAPAPAAGPTSPAASSAPPASSAPAPAAGTTSPAVSSAPAASSALAPPAGTTSPAASSAPPPQPSTSQATPVATTSTPRSEKKAAAPTPPPPTPPPPTPPPLTPAPAAAADSTSAPSPALVRGPSSTESDSKGPFLAGGRGVWVMGGVGVLLLLVTVVIVLTSGGEPAAERGGQPGAAGTRGPTNSSAPSAGASPGAAPSTAAPAPPAVGPTAPTLPAGWYVYQDRTGFSVPAPQGWRVSREGTRVRIQEPGGGRLLMIDQTDRPEPDPVADWKSKEAHRRSTSRNYQRVGEIRAVDYWDKAADWEWLYTSARGNRIHVRNRGFVTAPDKAYAIYWSTPASTWAENLDEFDLIARGFRPVRS